ncbi:MULTISPECIES: LysE family translocator [unclassified Pseudomonas]|uniref:LysE family translocator n=1 Tax=unclassified Pseudomonas TaxID=196821 RepID=UPI0025CF35B5|nr:MULTISPECIES: LysE family translocator [unclassified Pseudomonas]
MIALSTLALFSGACLALAITPGPDMLLIASRSASQGKVAGFASLAGIQLGTYCHALAAALGLSQLFVTLPIAYDVVRFIGAAYLLYLAFKTFRSSSMALSASTTLPRYSRTQMFFQGLLTNVLNPKMALFVLALFPQFIDPNTGSIVLQMLLLATVLNVVGLIANGAVIIMASRVGSRLGASERAARWLQKMLGMVFVGLACRLALAARD